MGIKSVSRSLPLSTLLFEPAQYDPTIEDKYNAMIDAPTGEQYLLQVLDTAGQSNYSTLRSLQLKATEAFVVVYSITDPASLNAAEQALAAAITTRSSSPATAKPPPGTKALKKKASKNGSMGRSAGSRSSQHSGSSTGSGSSGENPLTRPLKDVSVHQPPVVVVVGNKFDLGSDRAIPPEQGQELADRFGPHSAFFEASAKTPVNVHNVFQAVVVLTLKAREEADAAMAAALITSKQRRKSSMLKLGGSGMDGKSGGGCCTIV